ncbi:MAG TPA: C39 family peptidase [Candidatus Dormibacteraeota bacterium]|nr:C39 family peptidase [Candidatus Dormibacteraeota bacterium]
MLSRKTLLGALIALVALSGAGYSGYRVWRHFQPAAAQPPPRTAVVLTAPTATPEAPATPTDPPTPTPLPPSVFIKVPYTSQFPYSGQWNAGNPHLEYCEAAALLMMSDFFKGDARDRIPPAEADPAMGEIVQAERRTFPGVLDLPLTSIGAVGTQLFSLRPTVTPVSMEAIERQLAGGRPVIVPVMTHGSNGAKIAPFYGAGNVYHVIVITGYDSAKSLLYTNDAGFVEGQNYAYSWATLSSAIDAADQKYGQGRVMLVFDKG